LGLMLAHHFFYAYLNEKSIDSTAAELPPRLQNQNNVNFIGTTIGYGGRIVLSMVVGTFAQFFWEVLRARNHTIGQIVALVNCDHSPFRPSALRAAAASLSLFLLSFIASAMALVVIFTPGSLTVTSNFLRTRSCMVPTVPTINQPIFEDIGDKLEDSTMGIYSSGSFMPPYQVDPAVACGKGAVSCSYNVSFVGAAFDCVDVTNTTDLSLLLDPHDPPSGMPFLIWDFGKPIIDDTTFTFLSQDLVKGVAQATNCTIYNATYEVGVTLDGSVSRIQVWSIFPNSTLGDLTFMSLHTLMPRSPGWRVPSTRGQTATITPLKMATSRCRITHFL